MLEPWGAWIAEWYHTWLWSSVHCAMPWAMSLSLGDDKLFFGPKHNIYALFMILFGLFDLILLFDVKFVMWIVKQKIKNKTNLFLKNMMEPNPTYLHCLNLCAFMFIFLSLGYLSSDCLL